MAPHVLKHMRVPNDDKLRSFLPSINDIGNSTDCHIELCMKQGNIISRTFANFDTAASIEVLFSFTGTGGNVEEAIRQVTALIVNATTVHATAQATATLPDKTPVILPSYVATMPTPLLPTPLVAPPLQSPEKSGPWAVLLSVVDNKLISFYIYTEGVIVGRNQAAQMRQEVGLRQILHDAQVLTIENQYVSKRHFEIVRDGRGKVFLRNISQKGTRVHGVIITRLVEVELRKRSNINFPGTNIVYQFEKLQ